MCSNLAGLGPACEFEAPQAAASDAGGDDVDCADADAGAGAGAGACSRSGAGAGAGADSGNGSAPGTTRVEAGPQSSAPCTPQAGPRRYWFAGRDVIHASYLLNRASGQLKIVADSRGLPLSHANACPARAFEKAGYSKAKLRQPDMTVRLGVSTLP